MEELIIDLERRLEEATSVTEKLDILEVVDLVVSHLDMYTDELHFFLEEKSTEINNKDFYI